MKGEEIEIGEVTDFFRKISVAAVLVHQGETLKLGDHIHIRGPHTEIDQIVESLEVDHGPVEQVGGGSEVGLLVALPAKEEGEWPENIPRLGNTVYRIRKN